MTRLAALRHPAVITAFVLAALTAVWSLIGSPISLITQIAIYTLYGAGVNLLVGYTGLVPFGASVFFGCASYAAAFFVLGRYGNDLVSLLFATVFSALLALAIGAIILRRRGLYFSLLTLAFSDRLRGRVQVDRRDRRRERIAGCSPHDFHHRLVVSCLRSPRSRRSWRPRIVCFIPMQREKHQRSHVPDAPQRLRQRVHARLRRAVSAFTRVFDALWGGAPQGPKHKTAKTTPCKERNPLRTKGR